MAIYRSPDSLSSCNDLYSYNDKLRIERRPDLKPSSIHSKDTISSSHSLSKEALERLERPSRGIIAQESVIFRRIGKYIFLSVALPPYFLLYGLPKWLLVEGFSWLTFSLGWLTGQVKKALQKPFDIVVQKINQIVFFVQMLAQRILHPVAKLSIQLRQFFQNLNARTQQVVRQFTRTVKDLLKKPGSYLANLARGMKNQGINVRRWLSQSLYAINERIQEGVEWIKQAPVTLLTWSNSQLQNLKEKHLNWKEKVISKFQISSKIASSCINWLDKHFGVVKNLIRASLKPVEYFFQRGVQPILKFASQKLKASWDKMSGFLNGRKKRVLEFLQRVQAKIKSCTPQQAFERFLPASFLARLPKLIRRILLAIKENPITYAVFRAGFKVATFSLLNGTKIVQAGIQGISNIFELAASKVAAWKKQAGQSCKSLIISTSNTFAFIKQGGAKGLHGSLVCIFMIGILFSWGCRAVGETTARWIEKISFHKQRSSS